LFLLPAGVLCVRVGNDKELQIGKTSSSTHHHMKCIHAWIPQFHWCEIPPWIHCCEIPQSTDMQF
jgi:hypothetical protein